MAIQFYLRALLLIFSSTLFTACDADPPVRKTTQTACQDVWLDRLCGTRWQTGCIDQSSHFVLNSISIDANADFSITSKRYADAGCSNMLSVLDYSGSLMETGDIALLDGSMGKKVRMDITIYDGNVIDPPTRQYTIFQISDTDPNILYMGDSNDSEIQRDNNNRVRSIYPFYKQ